MACEIIHIVLLHGPLGRTPDAAAHQVKENLRCVRLQGHLPEFISGLTLVHICFLVAYCIAATLAEREARIYEAIIQETRGISLVPVLTLLAGHKKLCVAPLRCFGDLLTRPVSARCKM